MVSWIKYVAKSAVAGATAFGGMFTLAIAEQSAGGSSVVANEWVTLAIATIIAIGGVFLVSNGDKPVPSS